MGDAEEHRYSSYTLFKHQVAGHGGIRKFGNGRLIKPAIPREVQFYQSASHTALKPYIPTFHGVLRLGDTEDSTSTLPLPSSSRVTSRPQGMEKPVKNEYIILQDISAGYKAPCVLDLKMGTRHYGEEADAQKRARAIRKCVESTSQDLGIRVCGMQVFQSSQSKYLRRDKSYGHTLTTHTFAGALMLFLWDGTRTRYEVVPPLLDSVRRLRDVVIDQTGVRFYASSLLLLYDGQEESPVTDVRVIDFAKAKLRDSDAAENDIPDEGFLLGLTSTAHMLEMVLRESRGGGEIDPSWESERDFLGPQGLGQLGDSDIQEQSQEEFAYGPPSPDSVKSF